jgi:hypothetical protein
VTHAVSTVDGRDVTTLDTEEEIAVTFQEAHQDLADQSMQFDPPETVRMTVDEVNDRVIRGSDEESEYVVPANTHKKQIRARDIGSERSYHRTIGHRRQIEVISPVSDESI